MRDVQHAKVELVPLRSPISNGALNSGQLPARLKVLGWGDNPSVKGNVRLSELSASLLPARQKETGFEKIALDFEHNTVPGSAEYERTTEPRRVAAYGVPRVVPGEGLFLESLEWTPAGRAEALNFADLSPAVQFDSNGNIIFVHSVALTRNGAVEGLSFFSVNIPTKNTMPDIKPENVITVAEFAPVVGLSATATKADVLGKLALLSALSAIVVVNDGKATKIFGADIKDGKLVLLDNLDGRVKKIEDAGQKEIATLSATIDGVRTTISAEDIVGLHKRVETLSATLKAGEQKADETERNRLLADATNDGKLIPLSAETIKTLPTVALKELIGSLPKNVVPLHARQRAADDKKPFGALKGLEKAIAAHQAGQ